MYPVGALGGVDLVVVCVWLCGSSRMADMDDVTCWVDPVVQFVSRIWSGLGYPLQVVVIVGVLLVLGIFAWRRKS